MTSSNSRYIRPPDRALLWSRSGGICYFPECDVICVKEANDLDPAVIIGQLAHIEANSDAGPRANASLSIDERNSHVNLIILCPNHHSLVDAQNNTYTVEMLREWKAEAESRLQEYLAQAIENVTFAELETVTQALVNSNTRHGDSITVIPLTQKMARNNLTNQTEGLLNIGLVQARQVQDFVENMSGLDNQFVDRLISGFANEYQRQTQTGLGGDVLFEEMRLFSSQGRSEFKFQAAGLAVLVYLFERCEVFEH